MCEAPRRGTKDDTDILRAVQRDGAIIANTAETEDEKVW